MYYQHIEPEDVFDTLADDCEVKYVVMDARNGMKEGVYDLDETISVNALIALLNCENVEYFKIVKEEV